MLIGVGLDGLEATGGGLEASFSDFLSFLQYDHHEYYIIRAWLKVSQATKKPTVLNREKCAVKIEK